MSVTDIRLFHLLVFLVYYYLMLLFFKVTFITVQ